MTPTPAPTPTHSPREATRGLGLPLHFLALKLHVPTLTTTVAHHAGRTSGRISSTFSAFVAVAVVELVVSERCANRDRRTEAKRQANRQNRQVDKQKQRDNMTVSHGDVPFEQAEKCSSVAEVHEPAGPRLLRPKKGYHQVIYSKQYNGQS